MYPQALTAFNLLLTKYNLKAEAYFFTVENKRPAVPRKTASDV